MRLAEMTNEQLIKQIDDDALARELYNRLLVAQQRVDDKVEALEHRIMQLQGAA